MADNAPDVDLLRARYYEEIQVGQRFLAPSVTITESMITTACGLFQNLALSHRDHRNAAVSGFRGPVAPGALTLGACIAPLALLLGKASATHLSDEIAYLAPVYAGDTLDVEIVAIHRQKKSRFGLIEYMTSVTNQNGEKVARVLTRMSHGYAESAREVGS